MKVHTKIDNAEGTISFLELVTKILSVRTKNSDTRKRDVDKSAISTDEDESLKFLESFADMAEQMTAGTKQLTNDTPRAISHTCKVMIELSHNLLSKTHEYFLWGKFSTDDDLKIMVCKLREGEGGTLLMCRIFYRK